MVLTKSINPENVSVALEGLTMATVAILATLRVKFAKAITLGTAIGEVLHKIFSPFTTKALEYALSSDYEKWVPVSILPFSLSQSTGHDIFVTMLTCFFSLHAPFNDCPGPE